MLHSKGAYLIVDDELWVLVEDWILALREGYQGALHHFGVEVLSGRLAEAVCLLDDIVHVYGVTVVEEVLRGNNNERRHRSHCYDYVVHVAE